VNTKFPFIKKIIPVDLKIITWFENENVLSMTVLIERYIGGKNDLLCPTGDQPDPAPLPLLGVLRHLLLLHHQHPRLPAHPSPQ
jgi:hypothetical protein